MNDVINKACFNICTDILLFIIYLTDEINIIVDILSFITSIVSANSSWNEIKIPNNIPAFLQNNKSLLPEERTIKRKREKQIQKMKK